MLPIEKGVNTMKLHSFSLFIKDAFKNILKNKLMSLATIFTLASGIFLFGITVALALNIFSITNTLEKDFKLAVYLEEELSQDEINKIALKIQDIENVESTDFVDKKAAFEELKKQYGETDLLDGLDGEDFLRDSYKITLSDLSFSKDVVKKLEEIEGIAKITKLEDEMETFKDVTSKAQAGTLILSIILALLAVLIIINTINISIFSRRKQINIMKYVGATDWYIRWPFIIEGLLIGLIASAISTVAIYFLYDAFVNAMGVGKDMLGILITSLAMPYVSFATVGMGILLGCIGSIVSVKKYLLV